MRNKNGLIRLIISIICCAVLFCAVFPASVSGAASDKIISNTESVKNNRIFSVPVSIKSDKMLTAATFTLSYDKNAVSYRSVETDIDDAIVKAYDEDGKTTVIFLHGDGVSLSDTPLLLNVRYKRTSKNASEIKISASDCVDEKVKNFTPPASAEFRLEKISDSSSTADSVKISAKAKSNTKSEKNIKSNSGSKSGNTKSKDDKDTSRKNVPAIINYFSEGGINYTVLFLVGCAAVAFAVLISAAIIMYRRHKEEETRKSSGNPK